MIVPSLSNAGRSAASRSTVVSGRMPSSTSTNVEPPRPGISTGVISSASAPDFCASVARACERAAQTSWSSRLMAAAAGSAGSRLPWTRRRRRRERVAVQGVVRRHGAVLPAPPRTRQQVRSAAHGLGAADGDDLVRPERIAWLARPIDGQAGQAEPVDRHGGDAHRQPGSDRDLPGRVGPVAGLDDIAEDDRVHVGGRDGGPLDGRGQRDGAELDRGREDSDPSSRPTGVRAPATTTEVVTASSAPEIDRRRGAGGSVVALVSLKLLDEGR